MCVVCRFVFQTAIPVSAPTTGVIVELYVEDGAVVDAGSKLCRLRHSDAPLKEQQAAPSTSAEAPPPVEQVSFTAEQPPAPSTPTATPTVPIDTPIPSTVPPTPPLPGRKWHFYYRLRNWFRSSVRRIRIVGLFVY